MPQSTTIDEEAKLQASLAVDIDNFRRQYKTKDSDIDVFFVGPSLTILNRYRFTLISRSTLIELEEKYFYRPDYLSFDVYGTTVLWPILMYVNDIPSIELFTGPEVLVPDYDAISEIAKYNDSALKALDVEELNKVPSYKRLKSLYSSKLESKKDPDESSSSSSSSGVSPSSSSSSSGTGGGGATVNRQEFIATSGQIEFNLSFTYIQASNQLLVYSNQMLMIRGIDYVEASTNSIQFIDGREENENITVIKIS